MLNAILTDLIKKLNITFFLIGGVMSKKSKYVMCFFLLFMVASCGRNIKIISQPSEANVTLNGRSFGKTPTKPIKIRRAYQIKIEKEGYVKYEGEISSKNRNPYSVSLKLDPNNPINDNQIQVTISSEPQGARIYQNEMLIGVTPYKANYNLQKNNYESGKLVGAPLVVFYDGYFSKEITPQFVVNPEWRSKQRAVFKSGMLIVLKHDPDYTATSQSYIQVPVEDVSSNQQSSDQTQHDTGNCQKAHRDLKQAEGAYNTAKNRRNSQSNLSSFSGLVARGGGKYGPLMDFNSNTARMGAYSAQSDMDHALNLILEAKRRISVHCRE